MPQRLWQFSQGVELVLFVCILLWEIKKTILKFHSVNALMHCHGLIQSFQNNGVAIACCGRKTLLSLEGALLAGDREDVDPVAEGGEALLGPDHSSRLEVPVWHLAEEVLHGVPGAG